MKRSFIILSCFLVLAFIIGLTDISLAARTENSRGETENDKLIGVYITTEYLDLFDYTGYLRDNYENANGKIIMEGDNDSYQGRLYAKLIEKTIINEDGSETAARPEYVFEGVEGFPYYCYNTVDEHGSCSTIKGDEAVSDGHNYVGSTDEGSSVTLEGIIYMSPRKIIGPYYLNPVYQTEDGRIYMVSGSGTSMSGDNTEGSSCSQSLDESKTVTENGKTSSYSFSVKISFTVMNEPELIKLLQYKADGELISKEEFEPGAMPNTLSPDKECSYIVLETYKASSRQEQIVTRTLYQSEDDTIESYYCRDDGLCVKQYTSLSWAAGEITG